MYLTTITINEILNQFSHTSVLYIKIHSKYCYWTLAIEILELVYPYLYRRNLITRILTFNYPWNVSGTFGIAHTFNHQKKFFNFFLQLESLKRRINESKYIWYWRILRWRGVTVIDITLSYMSQQCGVHNETNIKGLHNIFVCMIIYISEIILDRPTYRVVELM